MKVRVLAFARLRELLGESRDVELRQGATIADLWDRLASSCSGLNDLVSSTRTAQNGHVVDRTRALSDGDEIALLPPSGGG